MPRFPDYADRVFQLPGSVFEKFRKKMHEKGPDLVRLHIGDTYLPPQYELPLDSRFIKEYPDFNRYCSTFGIEPLRSLLAEKIRDENQLPVSRKNILVTSGATNALSAAMMTLVNPGEEVIILTPAWPFFFGLVKVPGGRIIEIPLYTELFANPTLNITERLEQDITGKTVAIYVNTPNNPSGKVLNREQLEEIARFARRHHLWIISDEAYDGLTFDERPHISIARLEGTFEQTITIFTFSKIFMFAGLRLGFLAANAEAVINLNKSMVHQLYSPSTMAQYMMIKAMETRRQWLPEVLSHYQKLRDMVLEGLEFTVYKPEGTYFIFFSIEAYLNGRTAFDIANDCLDAGVSVALGSDFGSDFENYLRICFTGESPERLQLAVERLNRVFRL